MGFEGVRVSHIATLKRKRSNVEPMATDQSRRWRRHSLGAIIGGLVVLIVGISAILRTAKKAGSIPLRPLTGRWRIGAEYFERRDVPTVGTCRGQLESLDAYARSGFDPGTIHPDVRHFYERTATYTLIYDVTWHRGFRIGAALASRLTSRIEQLNLPGPRESSPRTLRSRFVEIDDRIDPLSGSRAWIRTDPSTGHAVFVAIYALYRKGDVTYENIAVPLPWSNLSTILHVDALGAGSHPGIELTTESNTDTGDEGLYLVTPLGAIGLPLDQTFRVWAADMPDAPSDITGGNATIIATHEMWIWGRKFLTIDYAGWIPEEHAGR